jgi:hypothetical protein
MKKKVTLKESDIRRIVKQSIMEYFFFDPKNKGNKSGYKNRKDHEEEDARKFLDNRRKRNAYDSSSKDKDLSESKLKAVIKKAVMESLYQNGDGFTSSTSYERDLWAMIDEKGNHDEDGYHIFLSPGIMFNGDELDTIHTEGGPENGLTVFGNRGSYEYSELPQDVQFKIFKDVQEYEPEVYDEDEDDEF